MENAKALVQEQGWRIFCGYCPLQRQTAGDLAKYMTCVAHFVAYNVNATSTTYSAELGRMQYLGYINGQHLTSYHYQYGEPSSPYGTTSPIIPLCKWG